MISPERLRRFPHCAGASDEMLKQVAMLGKERSFKAEERLFEEGKSASHLIMLEAGQVDIVYTLAKGRQVIVDTVVAGDLLAWSALMEPYKLTATGVARGEGMLIEVEAEPLRKLCQGNPEYGFMMMKQVAMTLRARLTATRVQLAGMS
ncbi:MAG TPA: cyclic nucleotide-binding domain-containing protein [Anaerolineales bacterium]|nr:cyclic nucleotide-binding domain-containing protein [Anaerolineales bacterium]